MDANTKEKAHATTQTSQAPVAKTEAAPVAKTEAAPVTPVAPIPVNFAGATDKPALYQEIANLVKNKTGKNIGNSGGQELFNGVVEGIFAIVAKQGALRFNGGYGSLKIRKYGAGSRRLPKGTVVSFSDRVKLRYEQGTAVTELISGKKDEKAPAA